MTFDKDIPPTILMSREGSSMASTWTEHLCISFAKGKWLIGDYNYNWAASINDIAAEDRYTDSGELKIPDEWDGHKVLGIADGEFIETDELIERGNFLEFDNSELDKAIAFAVEFGWSVYPSFEDAMTKLKKFVSDNQSQISSLEEAASNNDWQLISFLINAGADINSKDSDTGRTALMSAIYNSGYLAGIRYLLKNGADVNAKDANGDTALDLAKFKENKEFIKLLLRYGATGNDTPSVEAKQWAAYYDDVAKANAKKLKDST